MFEIRHYLSAAGEEIFQLWLDSIADLKLQARISARINRLAAGNFGDCKSVGEGAWELRIDWGPGYRVYYAFVRQANCLIVVRRRQASPGRRHRPRKEVLARLQTKDRRAMKDKTSTSHRDAIVKKLRTNRAFAVEYLKASMEDTDEPQVLLMALREIADARGGIAKVAKAAGVERESLYRALSRRGNPRLSTLFAATRAMGLTLTVEAGT